MNGLLLVAAFTVPLLLAPAAAMRRGRWLPALAVLPALAAAALVPTGTTLEMPWLLLGSQLVLDATGRWFLAAGAVTWLAAALMAGASIAGRRFRLFFTLAMAGSLWLTVAADMVGFYLGFAVMGLAAYGLVAERRSTAARRAARRYLAWTLVGEVALFAGLVLLAAAAGGTAFADLATVEPPGAAVALVVLGFGIKLALPGLHLWLPAAYAAAPGAGAAALAGPMIAAGLLGWLRFLPPGAPGLAAWGEVLVAWGLAGAFYGVAVGLPQRDPRVVLGYSSVAKMGLLAAGFGHALTVPAAAAPLTAALALYAAHHTLAKGGLFLGLELLADPRRARLARVGLTVLALVLAGAPLTGGAVAKAALGAALPPALDHLYPWLTAAGLAAVLLMGRFLWLVLGAGPAPRRAAVTAPGAVAFAGLVAVALAAPPLLAPAADLVAGSMVFAGGAALAALAAWLWPRGRPVPFAWIPPGDVLHLIPHPPRRRPAPPPPPPASGEAPARRGDGEPRRALLAPRAGALWLVLGALVYLAVAHGG